MYTTINTIPAERPKLAPQKSHKSPTRVPIINGHMSPNIFFSIELIEIFIFL